MTNDEPAVVLFLHHRNDLATRHHRDLLRKYNEFPIVPIFCDDGQGGEPLDDAVHVPMTFSRGLNWHNVDWICREWFRSEQRIDALRYIWLEWDCRADMPLDQWYGDAWDQDFIASESVHPPSNWHWFKTQAAFLPRSLSAFTSGVIPMNGVLLSRRAMTAFCETEIPDGIFSELRLATVLASCGMKAGSLPPEKARTNRFLHDSEAFEVDGRGLFHPVKEFVKETSNANQRSQKLVATMLCANNEDIVAEAIESVLPWVDHILLIDTGVTDSTIERAKAVAGKKFAKTSFGWCGDFAKARNFALKAADQFGATWAMTLDSDERFELSGYADRDALVAALDSDPEVLSWCVLARDESYAKERFIRVPSKLRWGGRTHEALIGARTKQRKDLPGVVFWEVAKTAEQFQQKLQRDLLILSEETTNHPIDSRWWYYLGQTYEGLGLKQKAIDAFQHCAALDGWSETAAWATYSAARCLMELKRYREAEEIAAYGMTRDTRFPELPWIIGFCSYQRKRYTQAIHWSQIAVGLGAYSGRHVARDRIGFRFLPAWHEAPYDTLRFAYRHIGDKHAAKQAETDFELAKIARELP